MKRVLVTGANGFIGRQAIPILVKMGHEVHAVTSRPHLSYGDPQVRWHQADLLVSGEPSRVACLAQAETLLHLAWCTKPGEYWRSTTNFRWVEATLELTRAFQAAGGRRIVAAGTSAEYEWSGDRCSEATTPLRPSTPYGVCKHALSCLLESFASEQEMELAWGRVFYLYGPHEHPNRLVSSVIRSLLRGSEARCSSGEQVRDFLYVADVADAFSRLIDSKVTGAVNIASGQPVTVRSVVEQIGLILERQELLRFGSIANDAPDPPMLMADVTRLREELKWTPAFELMRGLEQTIEWWREIEDTTHITEVRN